MFEQAYLTECLARLKKLKTQADRATAQMTDEQLFATLDPESNSAAIIMKHVAGNMRSRWTDFLASDGEKPDRDRDSEFEVGAGDSRAKIVAAWEDGWVRTLAAISSLGPDDLGRIVTVRGEQLSVLEAIGIQFAHYAGHVGQIVLLAKHYAGPNWKTLSIARRKPKPG